MNRNATSTLVGIGYVILAGACFATLDTTTKFVSASVPALMALWVRYVLQAVLSTAVLAPLHGKELSRTRHTGLQILRGLLLVGSTVMAYFSLSLMPVGEFTAIVMVTPMAVTVLAVTVFGERVAPLHWVFLAGGLVGTLLIVRPGGDGLGWAALLPLGCMVTNSAYQLLTGRLSRSDSPATTHFYSVWVGAAAVTLALPLTWTRVDAPLLWGLMVVMGTMGAVGHFLLALAYQHASAATLMPYLYSHVGFAVLGGWIAFDHVPDAWSGAGMGLIALCGVCSAWLAMRERRTKATAATLPEV